ncbi:MAG: hypothetical protein IAX21_03590 [Candidatus Bathyarchaeota archaeon]|nr:MAG: hypothetical protein IAX21_03590 [Candidatus Bathyarchaeota archaeon]
MLEDLLQRSTSFLKEAAQILSIHEAAPARVVILDNTYKQLENLSIIQDELLRQSLRCIENNLYRAAHILAWNALIDLVENILASDNFVKLKAVRPRWQMSNLDELRENYPEYQIIEVCKPLKLANKGDVTILKGLLCKRNQCAHPSDFFPNYNQTLGYIADILDLIARISAKAY